MKTNDCQHVRCAGHLRERERDRTNLRHALLLGLLGALGGARRLVGVRAARVAQRGDELLVLGELARELAVLALEHLDGRVRLGRLPVLRLGERQLLTQTLLELGDGRLLFDGLALQLGDLGAVDRVLVLPGRGVGGGRLSMISIK